MSGFKISTIVCLVIFHLSNFCSTAEVKIIQYQMDDIKHKINQAQNATIRAIKTHEGNTKSQMNKITSKIDQVQNETIRAMKTHTKSQIGVLSDKIVTYADEQEEALSHMRSNMSKRETEMKNLNGLIASKQEETLSLLRSNNEDTMAKMTKTNELLDGISKILTTISKKGDPETYSDLAEVTSQVEDKVDEPIGGAVYLITEEVRYPQEALGLLSLGRTYNKKVAPTNKTVRGWMRPTFVTDIDSMKQRMGLEIFFVLM